MAVKHGAWNGRANSNLERRTEGEPAGLAYVIKVRLIGGDVPELCRRNSYEWDVRTIHNRHIVCILATRYSRRKKKASHGNQDDAGRDCEAFHVHC